LPKSDNPSTPDCSYPHTFGEEHVNGESGWLFVFIHVWSGQVVATSYKGATMADKSPGKTLRKPAQSFKERRAIKRAKVIESTRIARKRKV
jgi:hypothetical protein